jgi:hypothetical protein
MHVVSLYVVLCNSKKTPTYYLSANQSLNIDLAKELGLSPQQDDEANEANSVRGSCSTVAV